jgi:hypothetical protein
MSLYKKRPALPPLDVLTQLLDKAQAIPTKTVTTPDWDSVWAMLERDGRIVLLGTYDQTRLFYSWAHKHKKHKISCQCIAADTYLVTQGEDK